MRNALVAAILVVSTSEAAFPQTPPKVDFDRDVQPLFKQHCLVCHGPAQQMNGLRLDERASAMKEGAHRIMPGSSETSLLYLRLIGSDVSQTDSRTRGLWRCYGRRNRNQNQTSTDGSLCDRGCRCPPAGRTC